MTSNSHKVLALASFVVLAFVGVASAINKVDDIVPTKIQGTIYCVSLDGKDWNAMKGAYARVSCLRFLKESTVTNENGYFTIDLPLRRLKECRVFLDRPADDDECTVPTNTNLGLAGAPLTNPTRQPDNSLLYSFGPFVFNTRYNVSDSR